jgi:hypothetical protein
VGTRESRGNPAGAVPLPSFESPASWRVSCTSIINITPLDRAPCAFLASLSQYNQSQDPPGFSFSSAYSASSIMRSSSCSGETPAKFFNTSSLT